MRRTFSVATLLTLVLLAAGLVCADDPVVRKALPVPDIPGFRTLKADLHMHTVFSDGEVWPSVRVSEAWRDDLDVIAITDHLEYHPHKDDVKTDAGRAYAIAKEDADDAGIILIPAAEITKDVDKHPVHFNALFVTDANTLNVEDLMEALRRARAQNAFVFLNHPGWQMPKLEARWWPEIEAAYREKLFQGAEIVNDQEIYPTAFPWFEEKKLTILCDSDVHGPMEPSTAAGRIRPITLIFAKTRTAQGVREALDTRRTAAWYRNQLWGPEEPLRALVQAAMSIDNPEITIRVPPDSRNRSFGFTLRVRNTSAIPLRMRIVGKPEWLSGGSGEVPAQGAILRAGQREPRGAGRPQSREPRGGNRQRARGARA